MRKLKCTCGHTVVDEDENLPYKGDIVPDKAFYTFFSKLEELVESLHDANNTGSRDEWIHTYFPGPLYPTALKDPEMISSVFMEFYEKAGKTVYQCEECGRIWIQRKDSKEFVGFSPDGGRWRGVLEG